MDLKNIKEHYESSLKEHGVSCQAVGWNSKEGQILRFEKLLSIPPFFRKKL